MSSADLSSEPWEFGEPPPPWEVLTIRDLRAKGLARADIDRGRRRGEIHRIRRGVYALGTATEDEDELHLRRLAGALATIGPMAVASHTSAALVRRLPLLGGRGPVTVTVSRATHRVYDGLSVHVATIGSADRTVCRGLPVTTTGRTLVDLTRVRGPRAGVVAADAAVHRASRTGEAPALLADWDRAIADARGRPGVIDARWVREHVDARAESPLETLLRLLCTGAGIALELQVPVVTGGCRYRLDAVVRGTLVAIECDGRVKYREATQHHAETVDDRVWEDRQRDWQLGEADWIVVHVTWDEVTRRPEYVLRRIRDAIARDARKRRPS